MTKRYTPDLTNCDIQTLGIHAGVPHDPLSGAITPPIYQTATYAQEGVGINQGYTYSRSSNPSVTMLENRLAALDGLPANHASCFATGLAALTTLCLSLLKPNDNIICSDVIFGGSIRFFNSVLIKYGITITYVDAKDPQNIAQAITKDTKMVFLETPANPTLKLNDIQAISKITKAHSIPLVIDNTFMYILQPSFKLGADIVLYSTTKYIDGHNATIGGALLAHEYSYIEQFNLMRKTIGNIQSPFNAWLIMQGLKTVEIRMAKHSQNAQYIAEYLQNHPKVSRVIYPGLKDFPQYELAKIQHLNGHGGMITFEVKAGYEAAIKIMNSTKLISLAESLGSAESLITHPASMTHAAMTPRQRKSIGISDGMIRLSVGLENVQDIINDLEYAINQI